MKLLLFILFIPAVYALPIFPGAEGFGAEIYAGSGRHLNPPQTDVYFVSNLNDAGPGSLRACTKAVGPRVCVFTVSGTIQPNSNLIIQNPYITIAGQTAPEPGISIRGESIIVQTHDVMIQHIALRAGDELPPGNQGEDPWDPLWEDYWFSKNVLTMTGSNVYNIMIDHVSGSWGVGRNFIVIDTEKGNITVSNSITSEALSNSYNFKGEHSKAFQLNFNETNISIIKNIFAHNMNRNPVIASSFAEIINNVVYNWGHVGTRVRVKEVREGESAPVQASVIGNVFVDGIDTPSGKQPMELNENKEGLFASENPLVSAIHMSENMDGGVVPTDPWSLVSYTCTGPMGSPCTSTFPLERLKAIDPPVESDHLSILPVNTVSDHVLQYAGTRPVSRNAIDQRVVDDVQNGLDGTPTGRIINCVEPGPTNPDCSLNAGGWYDLAQNTHTLVLPANINDDDDGDGYTNLEEWLHQKASEVEGTAGSFCVDGTPYGECSASQPSFCSSGTLIDDCDTCGCPDGDMCSEGGVCVEDRLVCVDMDFDGYGDPASTLCTYSELDCDDSDPQVNPMATEVCGNGVDENCDGVAASCDLPADFDGDGDVDTHDFILIVTNYGQIGPGDLTGDNFVDITDLALFGRHMS